MSDSHDWKSKRDSTDRYVVAGEPPQRLHRIKSVRCVSETGEKRLVVYEPDKSGRWIDAPLRDVVRTESLR
jgi:hypothetical protein